MSFLLEHNISFSVADHFGSLLKSMFPQLKEVMSYASGRTKTTILVQELASHYTKHMIDAMRTVPFCIATDGGNDRAMELTLPNIAGLLIK